MEKHNIDKLFASKLQINDLDFNPKHWEDAKKLIKEKDRKRTVIFWIWGGVAFLITSSRVLLDN